MLRLVSLAAATAALGTALDLVASRAPQETGRAAEAGEAVAEAGPLLRRMSLEVPDLRAAPVLAAPARAVGGLAAPPFTAGARSADDAARALECLTAAVYHEARSENADGQRAVAQVVLNRVRDRAFPPSVCGVVYQGSNRATGCQFTFTCDGSLRRTRNPAAWARAEVVARGALNGEVYAPVGSATHYHASYISPWWAPRLARIGAVGAHVFYRWRGALERALTFRQAYAGAEPGAGPAFAPAVAVARVALDEGLTVRVHRGAAPVEGARTLVSAGVRVHLNRRAPDEEAGSWPGAFEVDGAVIGSESEAI